MKAVIQRVKDCSVISNGKNTGNIAKGILIYLGIGRDDSKKEADLLCNKIINLRIFPDHEDKMNLSLLDIKGEILLISQFTLYADSGKGRRPSYHKAAPPETAVPLYEYFISALKKAGITPQCGIFGAHMEVSYCNDGPVTIIIDTSEFQ